MLFLHANALQMPLHLPLFASGDVAVVKQGSHRNQDAQQPDERQHR
jgi:hypothetical protein